ncbi:uncharacterized protein Z519_01209 [Cladophialophora bantiana CBS 173.52]|uniref:ML-like domain-containing protein n=1 Tax=Cladophialophora bantiana (strain ATCC 10958 / CBS 173.52 / CDC B-1940 / NIH 8579) TaxID=1442370 RepID=A0A0D2I360_CLAB1|nr:uncharacterized protein Z519_01209 [Cladophialophora bantiana CBS 173.52]KIW97625.1 hypothetical protein Z519_01209 [Cladophialophora bantiana CBS 173.52]
MVTSLARPSLPRALVLFCLIFTACVQAIASFTIVNGQIYTPGLAIIDAPQPFTPEGGDFLQVAIDISGDGRIPQPPYSPNVETGILNITIFLFSYVTGLNLTISNGTSYGCQGFQNAGCEEIMAQESGSTVKHVNWAWPECFVNDGDKDSGDSSARGSYNVSIHQSFRINGTGFYTIFNLPIQVTNSIPKTTQLAASRTRPSCDLRNNSLQNQTSQDASVSFPSSQPYLGGALSTGAETRNQAVAGMLVLGRSATGFPILLITVLISSLTW